MIWGGLAGVAARAEPMSNLSAGSSRRWRWRGRFDVADLMLLDEPTTGLDPRSKRDVQAFVRDVQRRTRDDPADDADMDEGSAVRPHRLI